MSIAVSVIVRPSPGLRLLHAGVCCCVVTSAVACPGWLAPALCVLAGALGWRQRVATEVLDEIADGRDGGGFRIWARSPTI